MYTLYNAAGEIEGHFIRWENAVRFMRFLHRRGAGKLKLVLEVK